MSLMMGKGYCLRKIVLLRENKSVICQTCPSFLGIMMAGDAHSEAPHGSRIPNLTMWLSSILKVCCVCEAQGKHNDVPA